MATNSDFAQAVEGNAVPTVRAFLRDGEPPDDYVCFLAIQYHANDALQLLLKAGADLAAIEHHKCGGGTPLMSAIRAKNMRALRLLLKAGASINKRGKWGAPLHVAAEEGSIAFTKACIAAGAKIDMRESVGVGGMTPLMIAAHYGHANVAKLLLRAGANPRLRDRFGRTACEIATASEEAEMAELLKGKKR